MLIAFVPFPRPRPSIVSPITSHEVDSADPWLFLVQRVTRCRDRQLPHFVSRIMLRRPALLAFAPDALGGDPGDAFPGLAVHCQFPVGGEHVFFELAFWPVGIE